MKWFEVDRSGLSKLVEGRDKHRVIMELIQNAWDENSTHVHVEIHPIANKSCVDISVRDDNPKGFEDLTHAFTLFAESKKKKDPEKRGRFNFGEKIVLALCNTATIRSTTGTVVFNENGRHNSRKKTESGSEFRGELRMSRQELVDATKMLSLLIPPIPTYINGTNVPNRTPIKVVEATLTTEISDDIGILRRTKRKTKVEIYECIAQEEAYIYEMGIPVVTTGDKYHVNVMQKVPLNTDRDNVTPAYLQDIRTIVLNAMHSDLSQDDCNEQWVRSASSDENCEANAMKTVMDRRFGEKRVIYDPSDIEANSKAYSQGYSVVTGSQLNAYEWKNVKRDNLMLPAGQVTPAKIKFDGSVPALPEDALTDGMKKVRTYTMALAKELMGVDLRVEFLDADGNLLAYYSREQKLLVYYVKQLGSDWFDLGTNSLEIDDLIIHEFGHEYESNHLSNGYYRALSMLGAKMKRLALQSPNFFITMMS